MWKRILLIIVVGLLLYFPIRIGFETLSGMLSDIGHMEDHIRGNKNIDGQVIEEVREDYKENLDEKFDEGIEKIKEYYEEDDTVKSDEEERHGITGFKIHNKKE